MTTIHNYWQASKASETLSWLYKYEICVMDIHEWHASTTLKELMATSVIHTEQGTYREFDIAVCV